MGNVFKQCTFIICSVSSADEIMTSNLSKAHVKRDSSGPATLAFKCRPTAIRY